MHAGSSDDRGTPSRASRRNSPLASIASSASRNQCGASGAALSSARRNARVRSERSAACRRRTSVRARPCRLPPPLMVAELPAASPSSPADISAVRAV